MAYDEHIRKFPDYIKDAVKRTGGFQVNEEINTVLVVGAGTGLLAGELLETYLGDKITAVGGFEMPFGDCKTLVFVASYTGDDPEAIALYRAAVKRGCRIVGLTSGGELKTSLERNAKERIILPAGLAENASLPYLFFTILKVLENSGIISPQQDYINALIHDLATPYEKTAEQFVSNLIGKIILIYSSAKLHPVARRWKMQFNVLARIPSFASVPELSELSGFGNMLAGFHAIILKDALAGQDQERKMETVKQGFRQLGVSSTEIVVRKSDDLTKLFSAIYMGDWIAYFLSQKYTK